MKTLISSFAALALLTTGATLAHADDAMGHNGSTMSNGKTAPTGTSTSTKMPNKKKKSRAPKSGPANSDVNATPHPASPTAPKSGPTNSDVDATPGK
jgi:hypothetical protein